MFFLSYYFPHYCRQNFSEMATYADIFLKVWGLIENDNISRLFIFDFFKIHFLSSVSCPARKVCGIEISKTIKTWTSILFFMFVVTFGLHRKYFKFIFYVLNLFCIEWIYYYKSLHKSSKRCHINKNILLLVSKTKNSTFGETYKILSLA